MQTTTLPCRNCGLLKRANGRIDDAVFKMKLPFSRIVLTDSVTISTTACLDCGNVELQVDPDKIKSILGDDAI